MWWSRPDVGADDGEVFFEFTAIGRTVKVSAIDATTGVEASVVGRQRLAGRSSSASLQKLKALVAEP